MHAKRVMLWLWKTRTSQKDCPDRAGTLKQTKKYNGKELHQHIRSLLKDMNDEEIDEFWKESEAQGF